MSLQSQVGWVERSETQREYLQHLWERWVSFLNPTYRTANCLQYLIHTPTPIAFHIDSDVFIANFFEFFNNFSTLAVL